MTGPEYEQFVRAVLCERLNLDPKDLVSTRSSGVTLPGATDLKHQIDLFYCQETEVAKYITIVECKYRSSGLVDQPELQNLAYVRNSVRAHKAIMVTNCGFTSGARAVAESEEIALLVIDTRIQFGESSNSVDVDALFRAIQSKLRSTREGYSLRVERRFAPDPNDKSLDFIEGLLEDPKVRRELENLLQNPEVRDQARQFIERNPDIARQAAEFLIAVCGCMQLLYIVS